MSEIIESGEVDTSSEGRGASDSKRLEKLHKQCLEHYKVCEDVWRPNREAARDDMRFQAGDQWPATEKKRREDDGRACLTVDKINQYVRQVVNDGRQNRPSIKVHPVDDQGDPKVAEAYQGIIRHIWRRGGDQAADTALAHAAGPGFGWLRVGTDFERAGDITQELRIFRVRNPLSVMTDPNAMEADGSDSRYGFVITEIPKDQFTKKYPKAKFADFTADMPKYADGWVSDSVRVVEYFYVVETPRNVLLLETGETVEEEDYWRAVKELGRDAVPGIERNYSQPICDVKWCRASGAEILEENDWQGKYIPLVPVFGNEYDVDGKVMYCGLIRPAKDAQRLYNYMRSARADAVANATNDFWVAADGQVEDYADEWQPDANVEVRRYKPMEVGGQSVPAPQRASPVQLPNGMDSDMQISDRDIQASMGMYASTTLGVGNASSGRQELLQQKRGDTSTFHYIDNLGRALCQVGRILVDLIPKYYGSRTAARILGEDGRASMIQTNPEQPKAFLRMGSKSIYNLNVGLYDASIETGPSFTTKRAETLAMMQEVARGSPEVFKLIADVMFRNMDIVESDKIARRFELMLPPEIQQAEEEGSDDPEVARVKAKAAAVIKQLEDQIHAAEDGLHQRDQVIAEQKQALSAKQAEVTAKLQDAETRSYDAETTRLKELLAALLPEQLGPIVAQTMRDVLMTPASGVQGGM